MDDRQFRELMSEFISNQWRMFWCYVSVAAVGVVILSIVFYATTRSDLQTIMRALDSANRQTAASNSVQILAPRTREDTIYDVLKSQGNVK
jgi:pilus assembly protein TadC